MTSPRIPASAMTTSLPRPRMTCVEPARAGEANQGAQLVGVVDRREQVGRTADAHRGEPGERLVARCLDPDPALDVGAGRDRVEARDHAPDPRASRSMPVGVREGRPRRGGQDELGHGVGRPGPAQRPCRGRHPGVRQRVVEQLCRLDQGVGVERLVLDQPGGSGLDQARRVRPLVPGRVRVGHDDHRHAERGHLGQRRGPGPADDEVGRGQRGEHLVAQERVRPVAPPDRRRAGPRDRPARSRSPRRR